MTKCTLCPRNCNIDQEKGNLGFCGSNKDNAIVALYGLHYWEEPCISGENGSGTVFFSGCTLKCIFCQNYEISRKNSGKKYTYSELADIFIDLQNKKANNINLVTPTQYRPVIKKAIICAKEKGLNIPVVYNTSGYETVESIKDINGLIDIYLPDMKYYTDTYAVKYSNAQGYFQYASCSIDEMVKQTGRPMFNEHGIMSKGVIVRHLVIPGNTYESKKILSYLHSKYGDDIIISIMNQFTPIIGCNVDELSRTVSEYEYSKVIDYADQIGITNAFIQDDGTADKAFIPDFLTQK